MILLFFLSYEIFTRASVCLCILLFSRKYVGIFIEFLVFTPMSKVVNSESIFIFQKYCSPFIHLHCCVTQLLTLHSSYNISLILLWIDMFSIIFQHHHHHHHNHQHHRHQHHAKTFMNITIFSNKEYTEVKLRISNFFISINLHINLYVYLLSSLVD